MYWMLLPPSANVGRHIEEAPLPHSGFWSDLFCAGWSWFTHVLGTHRR